MQKNYLSRRIFLKKSVLTYTGLMVGLAYEPKTGFAEKVENSEDLGIWIRISLDGTTTSVSYTHLTLPTKA